MKMCFHSNQQPWATKHPFISLNSKHQSLRFICPPVMNSPVFPSLDDIYCMYWKSGTEKKNCFATVSLSLQKCWGDALLFWNISSFHPSSSTMPKNCPTSRKCCLAYRMNTVSPLSNCPFISKLHCLSCSRQKRDLNCIITYHSLLKIFIL